MYCIETNLESSVYWHLDPQGVDTPRMYFKETKAFRHKDSLTIAPRILKCAYLAYLKTCFKHEPASTAGWTERNWL